MTPPDAPHNRWSDLDRPPLNGTALRRGLLRPDALWTSLEVVESTGSTNTDLAGQARGGAADEGTVLVAEEQTAGRGRLERTWTAPPRSGLFFSVYLEPGDIPVERWGWVPLLAGVAAATGLAKSAGVDMSLKWPNDLLVTIPKGSDKLRPGEAPPGEERKTGGILGEFAGDGIVVGLGINVSLRADELPAPTAGSLALAGAVSTDRETLLRAVLRSLEDWYGRWKAADGDAAASGLQAAYAAGCATLDRTVRAELPGGTSLVGEAVAIDGDGRLVLSTEDGLQQPVSAGDIVHLRGAAGGLT
ncbi:biotin--[acetyl-CoA-carboxylase] ligase [Streptomyces anulatus]|uniref:biotin--[acetyl-CoA-carboxylase] ligase n=1 Tax=Streptomyces TaxID=1883 RepID=UPI000BEF2840|nr:MULTISPECIES: biotin--[acetyl-CoA-carboxylase] ligase [unclassified Streptomyces]UPT44268.1 biotin--[acetyl-CoA-carboxylase] ligase [Streptomyces sp. WAC00303]WTF61981.1 biotin--[acetyl-CoA-carboxylase] ligase [Streptomyces anulatus]